MGRSRNLSVSQFQDLMDAIPKVVAQDLRDHLFKAGEELVAAMKPAVPRGIDGRNELLESIRVEQGRRPLQVFVRAGGPKTTREVRRGSGEAYDYANANEFGTENMPARPFFYPTYRLKRKPLKSKIGRGVKKSIAKVVNLR